MIPFVTIEGVDNIVSRIQANAKKALALAQSAQDVANAIRAIFTTSLAGSKTLTLGATAPDSILTTTPTRWVTIIESDGLPTIIAGYR